MSFLVPVVNKDDCVVMLNLANAILPEVYGGYVPQEHIKFLLEKFYDVEVLFNQVSTTNCLNYLLNVQGESVGYLSLEIKEHTLKLDKLYLLESCRENKLGSKALDFTVEKAKELKCDCIELIVHEDNTRAISFYKKFNFKLKKALHHEFENGHSLDGFLMMKNL